MSNSNITYDMPGFGDESSAAKYMEQVEASRAAQRVPYAVAPGRTLDVQRNGRLVHLKESAEVLLSDLADGAGRSPMVQMQELIRQGVVLHVDEHTLRANLTGDVPYKVGRTALTTSMGILCPGEEIRAEWVSGEENLQRLVREGFVIARDNPTKPTGKSKAA